MLDGIKKYSTRDWLCHIQHTDEEDASNHDLLSNSQLQSPYDWHWNEQDQDIDHDICGGVADIVVVKVVSIVATFGIVGRCPEIRDRIAANQ